MACEQGDRRIVELLIAKGANVNVQDKVWLKATFLYSVLVDIQHLNDYRTATQGFFRLVGITISALVICLLSSRESS